MSPDVGIDQRDLFQQHEINKLIEKAQQEESRSEESLEGSKRSNNDKSALASSGSGESSFSVCLSQGDPDRAESLAAQEVKVMSIMGSVFNGSNLGGSIYGGSLNDSEMSSDDGSSMSSRSNVSSRSSRSEGD